MSSAKNIFKGRTVDLWLEQVALPNERTVELEIIRHPGASAIVAIDDEDRVHMVRQFRHAAGGFIWELPAGKLDDGEAPLDCATRELREETGLVADEMTELGWIHTTPGFCDERIHLFLAEGLRQKEQNLGDDEVLTVEAIALDEVVAMIQRGEINDAKSIAGIFRAQQVIASR